jgi:hypothetical protein
MKVSIRALALIILVILISASAYVYFFTSDSSEDTEKDTTVPQIVSITGNTEGTSGKITTISATFSDNVGVTQAILYYKSASATSWNSQSILNGSTDINIPISPIENWYYYIIVNDAAMNGPVGDPSTDGSAYYTIIVSNEDQNIIHTVFIEEGTETTCVNCPNVADILHKLYEDHTYNFYYISLINDTNPRAAERNWKDYNIYGYPTVFIDGGYKVIIGGNNPEKTYANAINDAQNRPSIPKIKITTTAQYKNTTQELTVNTIIENKGNDEYNGKLKLYLTEIVSHVTGYDSKPYNFAFLDYLLNKDITVAGNGNATYS